MQNAENKSKKYVVLATYVIAVLCLLAGLFVPLFDGKNILALKLGEVFKSLLNKESEFSFTYPISLFGIEKLSFDFMALVIVLYTVITALALLSFVPVALSVRKEGKVAKKFYYAIEIAAVIVLSLFFVVTLQNHAINYNMIIAICGTAVALVVLSAMDKGKTAFIKILLFLLSAVGFLALFDIVLLSENFAAPFNGKLSPALIETDNGANYLNILFASKISDILALLPDAKNKALLVFAAIAATVVLLNFFIDTIKLATKKDKKFGRIFDIARYGLEVAAAVCVLVTALICKSTIGIMLIVILAAAALKLAIVIIAFVTGVLKKTDNERVDDDYDTLDDDPVDGEFDDDRPVLTDDFDPDDYTEEQPPYSEDDFKDDDYLPLSEDECKEPERADENNDEDDDDDGYISPEEDMLANEEHTKQTVEEEPAEQVKPIEEEIEDYEIKTDGTYLLPAEDEAVNKEPVVEEQTTEEIEEAETVETEPVIEEQASEEPVAEVEPEEIKEAENEVKNTDAKPEEPVQRPYHEEIKPYNPYEKRSNPFRNFEQPPQPYNPYATQAADKPVQPERKPVQSEKPVQPVRPVYEQKPERKPVQTYRSYEPATERPQSVRPLRPSPIIQEFKPVPPISEQPPREKQVYTIDKIYAGPIDDFIRKLSNDERIEFAMTFIEKSRGELGSIPDYVVGGDNKKFFSLSFIYLGRIRGLVSDGLLNKMYKELNML